MSSEPKPSDSRRRRQFYSLAFRLNAWYVVAFVASLAALAAVAVPTVRGALDRANTIVFEERVNRHVAMLATGLPEYRAAVEHSAALGNPEVPVRIRDANGTTVYEHGDLATARLTTERITGDLRLQIGAPAVPWSTVVDQLRPEAIMLGLGALVLAVIGGYLLTRRGLRPVRERSGRARRDPLGRSRTPRSGTRHRRRARRDVDLVQSDARAQPSSGRRHARLARQRGS